jgi:hypothetical protein
MISISIGDKAHNPDYAWMYLKGEMLPTGLMGGNYEPACSSEETVTEEMTLSLKGTHEQMDLILKMLEEKVMLANLYAQEGVGYPHYLRVWISPNSGYYYSQILEASLIPGKRSMTFFAGGSLGVVLRFKRKNYFDSDEVILPIANGLMGEVTTGLTVLNHDDSAHDHHFSVDMDNIETELPAPLRLEIKNTDASNALNDLWIGSFQYNALSSRPKLVYEAESGSGGTTVSSGSASNGAFQRFTWTAEGWSDLTHWDMSLTDLARYLGRAVMAMIRLANTHAYSGLLMKISITSNGITLWEGNEVPAVAGNGFVALGTMRLPCGETLGTNGPYQQEIHLHVYKEGTSSYILDIDDLLLIPQDSFTQHMGLVPLAQNEILMDDAFNGVSYGIQSDYEMGTHIALNKGHFIMPKHHGYFMVFQANSSDVAPIAQSVSVRAWYRQRRRIL